MSASRSRSSSPNTSPPPLPQRHSPNQIQGSPPPQAPPFSSSSSAPGPPPLPSRPSGPRWTNRSEQPGPASGGLLSSFLSGGKAAAAKAKSSVDYLATNSKPYRSALVSASSYIAHSTVNLIEGNETPEKEKTWGEWAKEWTARRDMEGKGVERLDLLPGWCVRVERPGDHPQDSVIPFDLHVSTSGFTSYLRSPEYASRSQKVFMRIAKGFAALPKLPTPQTILHDLPTTQSPVSTPEISEQPPELPTTADDSGPQRRFSTDPSFANITEAQLRAFHSNLDARLQPFWSSALQRRVSVEIYTIPLPSAHHHNHPKLHPHHHDEPQLPASDVEPLSRNTFMTTPQGQFSQKIVIPWERIVSHPPSLAMAFAGPPPVTGPRPLKDSSAKVSDDDWAMYIKAELLSEGGPDRLPPSASALPTQGSSSTSAGNSPEKPKRASAEEPTRDEAANAFFSPAARPQVDGPGGAGGGLEAVGKTTVQSSVITPVAGAAGVRVISDLDDTVKVSNILSGAREVFRNVFCKPLDEVVVAGMADFYCRLAAEGAAGFHYVSNGPSHLFPVLTDFFRLHPFPRGFSMKLKFYGGSNIINGLFEPPGERKRPSVVEILDSFPQAKFVLIGDSGEQDLELYVAIARERPQQVLAILIRDVTSAFAAKRHINTSAHAYSGGVERHPTASEVDLQSLSHALNEQEDSESGGEKSLDDAETRTIVVDKAVKIGDAKDDGLKGMTPIEPTVNPTKRIVPSRTSSSSTINSLMGRSSRSSRGGTPEYFPPPKSDATSLISSVGATGASSLPSSISTDELVNAQTQQELQALSAQQLKLQRRAEEWVGRMMNARRGLPAGIMLEFFEKPEQIEEKVAARVREVVEHWGEPVEEVDTEAEQVETQPQLGQAT